LRLVRQPREILLKYRSWLNSGETVTSAPLPQPDLGSALDVNGTGPPRLPDRAGGPRAPSHRSFRVLFVLRPGTVDAACMRYRAYNVIEALRLVGIEASHLADRHIPQRLADALAFDLIVLVRRQMTPEVSLLLDAAEQFSIPVVYDIDDYLFDDEVIPYVEMLRSLPIEEARGFVRQWREVLVRCNAFIGTTAYLTERAAALGKRGYLIRNGLNQAQLDLSHRALLEVREAAPRDGLRLGYFSGTRTHQNDFRKIAAVLDRLLSEFPNVSLIVAGDFDLAEFPEFGRFAGRVEGRDFVDWRLLPAEIARADINLIPLEINLFTEAKSNLKYYEAALLKIPSVASPTGVYSSCITHGVNGFLACSENEWYEALRALILDPDLRRQIGERAFRHVLGTYAPPVIAEEAISVYRQLLLDHRRGLGIADDSPTVVVLLSDLGRALRDRSSTITLARELARAGASVTLLLPEGPVGFNAARAWEWITERGGEPPFAVQVGGEVPCCDILLATDSRTAHRAKRAEHRVGWAAYVVSEYEPAHLPLGEEREHALASYQLGLELWVLDPTVADLLSRHHHCRANLLPAWVEARPPEPGVCNEPRMVLVAATSSLPDRAWEEAVAALNRIEVDHPDVRIVLCGDAARRATAAGLAYQCLPLPDGVWFSGHLAEQPVCVALYPSGRPPWVYDLIAASCAVITVASCLLHLPTAPEHEEGLIGVHADAGAIAKAIDALLSDRVRFSALTARAAARAADMPAANEAARTLLRAYHHAVFPAVSDHPVVRVAG
jgi:glycosyltransferase involved in cell wall biosynthesis